MLLLLLLLLPGRDEEHPAPPGPVAVVGVAPAQGVAVGHCRAEAKHLLQDRGIRGYTMYYA